MLEPERAGLPRLRRHVTKPHEDRNLQLLRLAAFSSRFLERDYDFAKVDSGCYLVRISCAFILFDSDLIPQRHRYV